MGKFLEQLERVLDDLKTLEDVNEALPYEEKVSRMLPIYQKIHSEVSAHIEEELEEEKALDSLIGALQDYKKHLHFAKISFDKDFTSSPDEQNSKTPRFKEDLANAKRNVSIAVDSWKKCKESIKHLLDNGKIKLD